MKQDGKVTADPGSGAYTKMDLGIAEYHFEIGSGQKVYKGQESE